MSGMDQYVAGQSPNVSPLTKTVALVSGSFSENAFMNEDFGSSSVPPLFGEDIPPLESRKGSLEADDAALTQDVHPPMEAMESMSSVDNAMEMDTLTIDPAIIATDSNIGFDDYFFGRRESNGLSAMPGALPPQELNQPLPSLQSTMEPLPNHLYPSQQDCNYDTQQQMHFDFGGFQNTDMQPYDPYGAPMPPAMMASNGMVVGSGCGNNGMSYTNDFANGRYAAPQLPHPYFQGAAKYPQHCQNAATDYNMADGINFTVEQTSNYPTVPEANGYTYNPPPRSNNINQVLVGGEGFLGQQHDLEPDQEQTQPRKRRATVARAGNFKAEKPKKDDGKTWIRINGTTEGKTCRTGKINQYRAEDHYSKKPNPFGNWNEDKSMKYNSYNELNNGTFTVKQIETFIYDHPVTAKGGKMMLWIQKAPADSARRYPTAGSSKCRFADCPIQRKLKGSIQQGHYRVAFDENWTTYGAETDPLIVAGYVHLYCFERFLDLPRICRLTNVEVDVDVRVIPQEPNHQFLPSLEGKLELGIAREHIDAFKNGTYRQLFHDYPDHKNYNNGDEKTHMTTLTYKLSKVKHESRRTALKQTLEARIGDNPNAGSQFCVHLGDLEMLVAAKLNMRHPKPKRARLPAAAAAAKARGRKRTHDEIDAEANGVEDDQSLFVPQRPTRAVARKVSYREDAEVEYDVD